MQKRKLKKISFIFASAALATMFAVPVAAAEDTAGQVESSGVYVFKDAKKDGTVTFIKSGKIIKTIMRGMCRILKSVLKNPKV